MVNGDNKTKQICKITFRILIRLFQKQTNKSNSENWLGVQKPKLNTNTEV